MSTVSSKGPGWNAESGGMGGESRRWTWAPTCF
jgi:hypothetical protein